jgi:arylformamidase
MMKIIDLSHIVAPDMPVYPGTEQPVFVPACTLEKDGFREKKITLFTHAGTHMDAPAHLIAEGRTLDQMPISQFTGLAVCISLPGNRFRNIELKEVKPFQEAIERCAFVLFQTGWHRYWGKDAYFYGFPVLTPEAGQWLAQFNLKGIGIDTISIDRIDTQTFPIHKIFLQHDMVIIENLNNLEHLPDQPFQFACFPIKFADADGSPVRAVAWLP